MLEPDLTLTSGSEEWLKLKAELDDLLKEQASGRWDKPLEGETNEIHEAWVQGRVRRTIELTSILRRTNTGPAKAKGARGKAKPKLDIASIKADLLS